jgi:hypothetical protein
MHYISQDRFLKNFHLSFDKNDPIREIIFDSLNAAYLSALDKHDPSDGSNNITFGQEIYQFACFQLSQHAQYIDGLTPLHAKKFYLEYQGFQIFHHKVGSSLEDNIESSFPASKSKSSQLYNPKQLAFDFEEEDLQLFPLCLVIAHAGSPVNGLEYIYLCQPGVVENDQIKSWKYISELWVRPQEETSNPASPEPKAEKPQARKLPKAQVKRKQQKRKKDVE